MMPDQYVEGLGFFLIFTIGILAGFILADLLMKLGYFIYRKWKK